MAVCKFNVVVTQKARADALLTQIGTSAVLKFYSGSPPADPSVTATGTLLATLNAPTTFGTTAAGTSGGASAVLTANAITTANGVANGTPGYCRIQTSGGVGVCDLDVTASGGGGSVIMTPNTITSGAPVSVTSLTITEA